MHLVELIILSIALGVDCLVVSFSQGLIFTSNRTKNSLALAFTMGIAQSIMPLLGYVGVGFLSKYIEAYSEWLVFAIFMALGIKFIYEAFQKKEDMICCIGLKCLIGLGIATSIDALAVGVSLAFLKVAILPAVLFIGCITFVCSAAGVKIGSIFGDKYQSKAELCGGIILILIGIKILLDGLGIL